MALHIFHQESEEEEEEEEKPAQKKKIMNGHASSKPAKNKQPQPESNKKTPNKNETKQNKKPVKFFLNTIIFILFPKLSFMLFTLMLEILLKLNKIHRNRYVL